MNVSLNAWASVPVILVGMTALLAALRFWQRRANPSPELVRKLFHLGGGMLALPLPWLFQDPLPVAVGCGIVLVAFSMLRIVPALRAGPGMVFTAVQRHTVGEFCYVASLFLLFLLARDKPLLYSVPLLVLAMADSFAALIGSTYGRIRFTAGVDGKSLEGSAAFFLSAFLCVHVPVLLFSDTPRFNSLLIGVNIGLMVMMAEAAAWWGLDNLIIPLFSYALLDSFLKLPAPVLIQHLVFLLALSMLIGLWRKRTTLADDALFGASLFGYMAWAMAGWHWVIPPLILIGIYKVVCSPVPDDGLRPFHFPVALVNMSGGVLWLVLHWQFEQPVWFAAYAAAFAANLSIVALVRQRTAEPFSHLRRAVIASACKGMLVVVPSLILAMGATPLAAAGMISGGIAVLAATAAFAAFQPDMTRFPVDKRRWARQAVWSTLASPLALLPVLLPSATIN